MAIVLTILAWLGIVIAALLALLLLVPLHGRAEGQVGEEVLRGEVRVQWGFGVLAFKLRSDRPSGFYLLGLRVGGLGDRASDEAKKKKKGKKKKKEGDSKGGLAWFREHRRALVRTVSRLLGGLDPRAAVQGVIGLGDPADTALAQQVTEQVAARVPRLELDLTWELLDEVLELRGTLRARVWLAQLAGIALLLLLDRDVRRMLGWGNKSRKTAIQHAGVR